MLPLFFESWKWHVNTPRHSLCPVLWSHMATISSDCVPSHTHRSRQTLKAVPPLCCEASHCAADNGHLLHFPVVRVLNPGKHFLRSLIASLRLSIYLSTLLNCVLLNPCQMKTDGLICPDVLPWLQESCKSSNPGERWTPKQARGRVKWFQATRCFWVPWESVDLETVLAILIPSHPGKSTSLSARSVTPTGPPWCHLRYLQGTEPRNISLPPFATKKQLCLGCAVSRALFLPCHPVCAVGWWKQKCASLVMAFLMSQWRHKLLMDP